MTQLFKEHSKKVQKSIMQTKDGKNYTVLTFVCPGCEEFGGSGLHMLPVNTSIKNTAWTWDGNLEAPTLSPSILTGRGTDHQCHSFLNSGKFEFLDDCKHSLKGKNGVEMPDLPNWYLEE